MNRDSLVLEDDIDVVPDRAVRSRVAAVWLSGPIVCTKYVSGGIDVSFEDIKELLTVRERLAGGLQRPHFVDMRNVRSMAREVREHLASRDGSPTTRMIALYCPSPRSRVIGNFFIGIPRLAVPTRIFVDAREGKKWILDAIR